MSFDPRLPSNVEAGSDGDLNATCHCLSLDRTALSKALESELGALGMAPAILTTHPNLFSASPVFVPRLHIDQMAEVVDVIEEVVGTSQFRSHVLSWAPEIARFDPGTRGGLLGFDFHLTRAGPRLIEINTNPGGALLNAVLGKAQRPCCTEGLRLRAIGTGQSVEVSILEVLLTEGHSRSGSAAAQLVAIVDERPLEQYLYPEFLLYQALLRKHGWEAIICDPSELIRRNGLWLGDQRVDFVYNRLTDFALQEPSHAALRAAYLAGDVLLSPHPHAHALYSDKRNLTALGDISFLMSTGIDASRAELLHRAIPTTTLLTEDNRAQMWANRRHLFFKPAAGYGSKATYRGAGLTKRVWEELSSGNYVAQELVAPSERHLTAELAEAPLKVDIRAYAYAGSVVHFAARLYRGQTTNFRTAGGGFAPVLVS